jgi:PTH1 family peptidyl-tRNA hydrolase
MKLIVGLGNPGKQYENTRHNIGFMALDKYASENNLSFKIESRFEGLITQTTYQGEKVILFKPVTYMNLSGRAIYKVVNYYKIDIDDILIIHDDLDLPTGKMRLREKGSSGGHNGLKSIIENLNTTNFKRVKIGISKNQNDIIDYVLGKFSKTEMELLDQALNSMDDLMVPLPKHVGHVSSVVTSIAGRTRWRVICINPNLLRGKMLCFALSFCMF